MAKAKFGTHSINWGAELTDLDGMLKFCAQSGLQGVEFFQHPRILAAICGRADDFRQLLLHHKLTFIGQCSGTLKQRIEFCLTAELQPEYLYVDEWDEYIPTALELGFTVAVHPHVYRLPQIGDVFDLTFKRCADRHGRLHPKLKWILDLAHFNVIEQDPYPYLEKYYDQLVAVHLKDWGPWYGHSYHRYAQGFCELGKGRVDLNRLLDWLEKRDFPGWIVIEQENKTSTPERSLTDSINFLRDRKQKLGQDKLRPQTVSHNMPRVSQLPRVRLRGPAVVVVDTILRAQETPEIFFEVVVQTLFEERSWLKCGLITLWAVNPLQKSLSLVASHPREPGIRWLQLLRENELDASGDAMCNATVRTRAIHVVNPLPDTARGRDFRGKFKVSSVISVPICNRFNPNDVEFVLNLFLQEPSPPDLFPYLRVLADYIAQAAERIISDRCTRATGAIRELYVGCVDRREFLNRCLPVIQEAIDSEGVTIFLKSPYANRLTDAASTGINWTVDPHERYYDYNDTNSRTSRQWQDNNEYISAYHQSQPQHLPRSQEQHSVKEFNSTAYVPLRNYAGQAIGILRCQDKITPRFPKGGCFSQVDVTVLQAIGEAIYPRLALFDTEEHVFRVFQRTTHELKSPLWAIKSDLDFIEDDCLRSNVRFKESYIEEARDVTQLMEVLIENAEVTLQQLDEELPEEPWQFLQLMGDVMAPLVDQMRALLRRYGLRRNSITYASTAWNQIPRLWIRPGAIRQVLFNLISNAVKYRHKDPTNFAVVIRPRTTTAPNGTICYHLDVLDWGPGIPDDESAYIFEWGRRGKNSIKSNMNGSGFGLAISRQIMYEHAGSLVLTNNRFPTSFTLTFPCELETRPPISRKSN